MTKAKAQMTLYHYWRSSCSWRVRWALNIKKIPYNSIAVNLLTDAQKASDFLTKNPAGFVPCLEIEGACLSESMAIIEWLEERWPTPALLPQDPWTRAKVRQASLCIVAGTQPLQNLRVQKYYSNDEAQRTINMKHWIEQGLEIFQNIILPTAGTYCFGGEITMADLCLVPQVYNALRFGVNIQAFPTIKSIYDNCLQLPSCEESSPERQPDAPKK